MDDFLPADPKARRLALVVWGIAAVAGSVAVWWLSSYLESLTELARTDREASLALFRSRVLPALMASCSSRSSAAGMLLKQGLEIQRTNSSARLIGAFMAFAGFLMAAVPLVVLSIVLWMLIEIGVIAGSLQRQRENWTKDQQFPRNRRSGSGARTPHPANSVAKSP